MKQATWEYLLRFTADHEVKVYHMYNNKASAAAPQDVTCGIGFFLPTKESACDAEIKALFINKTTRQPAGDAELMKDWETASNILRVWGNAPNLETEYTEKCQLVMDQDKTWTHMQTGMKRRLAHVRRPGACQGLDDFAKMPAQAQVALTSFNYGWFITSAPILCNHLMGWDFDSVQKSCYTTAISAEKLLANRTLFWNAARILEQNQDFDHLPTKTKPPELAPWKAVAEVELEPGAPLPRPAPSAPDTKKYAGF
jgi:hypothetical protein